MTPGNTGPSTSETPYLTPTDPRVRFVSLLSAGDTVLGATKTDGTPWRFAGIPDGIGALEGDNDTITVLVNHELQPADGGPRDNGAPGGAYVDKLSIDEKTLKVVAAQELGKQLFLWDTARHSYVETSAALARLCSADLPAPSAFYDAKSGLGTKTHIYLNGEEAGTEGRGFAWIVDGADAGQTYELAALGNLSFENLLVSPNSGEKTVLISSDDTAAGQLYVYVGEKQATGSDIVRAGLTGGTSYGIKTDFLNEVSSGQALSGSFSLAALGDLTDKTGADLQAASNQSGVTGWLRPEDGAWDTKDPNRFYFVTTNAIDAPSRLWALDFKDVKHPERGGTYTALLDGTEGQKMLDNMTVSGDGTLVLQEDAGNNARSSRIWSYDPQTDALTQLAQHDVARFGDESSPATAPFNQDEESSGIIDVSELFPHKSGEQVYLLDTQAHAPFGDAGSADRQRIVEYGQLQLMYVDADPKTDRDGHDDKEDRSGRRDDSHAKDDRGGHASIDDGKLDLHGRPDFLGWDVSHHGHGGHSGDFPTLTGDASLVIGHRGASGLRPEHTLESYKLAIDQGADFIEPDLVPTKDGYLIARHEPELGGTTDVADHPEFADRKTTKMLDGTPVTGWFAEDFTLAEIKTLYARERIPDTRPGNMQFNDQFRIPTFDEIIDLVKQTQTETGRKIGIIPETKHPTYFKYEGQRLDGSFIHTDTSQKLIDTLVAKDFTDFDRVIIQSFEVANLIDLQTRIMPAAHVDVPLAQLLNTAGYDITFNFDPAKVSLGATPHVYDTLDFKLSADSATNGDLYSPAFLKAIHELYAELIGPFKDDILPTTTLSTPVDGNGDGKAEITRQLTGQETSLVHDAHTAGLKVVPYTLRSEEVFQALNPDGSVVSPEAEFLKLIAAGVDGFFTDFPGTGRQVVNEVQAALDAQRGSHGSWHDQPYQMAPSGEGSGSN